MTPLNINLHDILFSLDIIFYMFFIFIANTILYFRSYDLSASEYPMRDDVIIPRYFMFIISYGLIYFNIFSYITSILITLLLIYNISKFSFILENNNNKWSMKYFYINTILTTILLIIAGLYLYYFVNIMMITYV